ncbi:tRNA epoxyqueuosine(34) reductase QueG [Aquirufa nivalisilvae]|uniref:tRNA epoxyqueuosine(34) reductase QueG n=1 Tax=Aquirufa nivalisilvae TaxID=2516557 RepID=UPI001032DE65|nr:tRNA epoxyqueuosine(34) reductase QueG [Aquirufa nivalisilvae]MCZ2480822.1 tRNA epoxyqueuosine(34) reductase QueG [Aquirufa nivalisilvae]MCZ2482138.1 tRNA epoxyqueuosine(34) reductase QueG [Aquirufa nivalisilvae]TBH73543.1 tRNA epoxyqueuosine(34) reductase QueG [Aquirufa nivalisilvae]
MTLDSKQVSSLIKKRAFEAGFSFCGISKADFLEEEAPRLEAWLNQGLQGEMAYMANHFDKRLDPRKLVEGCQTVVSLVFNYYPSPSLTPLNHHFKVSKYAFGEDYHRVVKDKMQVLWDAMQEDLGEISGRMFVDSAPVLEKAWAKKSGLGWIGKNGNLIIPKQGSFYFIAELLIDIPAEPDGPIKDFCGTCTRCIDACPTEALTPYWVDGSKCISYFTIELKEGIPASMKSDFQDWIFGCDICQDVCPWNRFSTPHQEPRLEAKSAFLEMERGDWEDLSEEVFKELFHYSAIKRTKITGLQRNIQYINKKNES